MHNLSSIYPFLEPFISKPNFYGQFKQNSIIFLFTSNNILSWTNPSATKCFVEYYYVISILEHYCWSVICEI